MVGTRNVVTIAIFGAAFLFAVVGHTQTNPSPSPSPALILRKEVKGIDVKNLAEPGPNKNLKWQKIVTGQEPIDGAALIGLSKNSLWRRLGFQNGDVIIHIDGKDFHSTNELDQALSDLKPDQKQTIDFKIIRGNQQMILNYQLQW